MNFLKKILFKYKSVPVQIRASFWFLFCSFLQKGISMITTPIFTRVMTTNEYGLFGVFNSWFSIVTVFVSLNLFYGVHVQGIVKFHSQRNYFTSSLLGLTSVLVVLWLIIYLCFQNFFNNLLSLTTIQILSMFIIIWCTAVFTFWANEQRASYNYKALVFTVVLVAILRPCLELFLINQSQNKVTARIIGWGCVDFVAYSWMFFYLILKGKNLFSKKFWFYALSFNLPLIPHYLSQTILNSSDRIMIEYMVGASESGIYSLAYSISLIMTLFNIAFAQTITPWVYQKISEKKEKETAPIAYITLFFVAAVNLILILFAPEVVGIFAPKSYSSAIWVIPPIAMSVFFMYCCDLFARFAFYFEKTKVLMFMSVFCSLLNILLNYIFIKMFGYLAAGYTTLICFIVFSVIQFCFMRKICRNFCNGLCPYATRNILIIAVPFIVIGFVFLLTYKFPTVRFTFVGIILLLLFLYKKNIAASISIIVGLKDLKFNISR